MASTAGYTESGYLYKNVAGRPELIAFDQAPSRKTFFDALQVVLDQMAQSMVHLNEHECCTTASNVTVRGKANVTKRIVGIVMSDANYTNITKTIDPLMGAAHHYLTLPPDRGILLPQVREDHRVWRLFCPNGKLECQAFVDIAFIYCGHSHFLQEMRLPNFEGYRTSSFYRYAWVLLGDSSLHEQTLEECVPSLLNYHEWNIKQPLCQDRRPVLFIM